MAKRGLRGYRYAASLRQWHRAASAICYWLDLFASPVSKMPPIIAGKAAIETTPNQGTGVHGQLSMIIQRRFSGAFQHPGGVGSHGLSNWRRQKCSSRRALRGYSTTA